MFNLPDKSFVDKKFTDTENRSRNWNRWWIDERDSSYVSGDENDASWLEIEARSIKQTLAMYMVMKIMHL